MNTTVQDVVEALARMPSADVEQVRKRAAALLALDGRPSAPERASADWLLDGILHAVDERAPPLSVLMRRYGGQIATVRRIQDEIEAKAGLSRTQLVSLGRVIGRIYADYLREWTTPCISTALRAAGHVPEAIDRALPGYLEAGLLSMLVARGSPGRPLRA